MTVVTGFGITSGTGGDSGSGPGGGSLVTGLSDNQIPRFDSATNRLVASGFEINPITQAMRGQADIIIDGVVQSGVSTFRLGLAHAIRSVAENVVFTNLITDTTFHPTWQTTERNGNWASVQRTPVGSLVENMDIQTVRSEILTNPVFMATSSANERIYAITIEPEADQTNVIVLIEEQNTAGEFENYFSSLPLTLVSGAMQTVDVTPFFDFSSGNRYRVSVSSPDGDVTLRGDTNGVPRYQITYREWEDRPLATEQFVSNTAGGALSPADRSKLDGIAAGAEVNVQSDFDVTDTTSDAYIANRPAIPDRLTDLTDTPAAINANQFLRGNVDGTAVEFATVAPGSGSTTWTGLTDTASTILPGQHVVGNAAGNALGFVDSLVLDGRIDIPGDITVNAANINQYERRLWFFDASATVTIEAGTGLSFFGVYVRPLTGIATLVSTVGSVIRFNNRSSLVLSGRTGNIFFAINPDIFRTLLSNSIGVTIEDNNVQEGRQITTLNFGTNLNVQVTNGEARIEALASSDPFEEAPRRFLSQLMRDDIALRDQQSGFDFGVFVNPIDTVEVGPGGDLAALNNLNTNQFTVDGVSSGTGFAYLLFQDPAAPAAGWTMVRTDAGRTRADYLATIERGFTEIPVADADVRLFMSNNRIQYNPNDVIAIYTITGGNFIRLTGSDIDITGGIPVDSISQDQLNFDIQMGGTTMAMQWTPCTLSTTTASTTVATLPNSQTVADFNDINVLWNSGTGEPADGSDGNANRYVSATSSLFPIRGGAVPVSREMVISAMGRGADQYSIVITSDDTTATTLSVRIRNINSADALPADFVITHVWVR